MTDEEILQCQSNDQPCSGQTCPGYVRCGELVELEYERQFGPQPSEDLPTASGEWVRVGGGAEYEVRDESVA